MLSSTVNGRTLTWKPSYGNEKEFIFAKELRAAVKAIEDLAPHRGMLVIAIDNTAAAQVLINLYSDCTIGRVLAQQAYDIPRERSCKLVVAGIPGVDNYADSPTRGHT